jgi:transducin (beta)-like 1
VIWYPFESENQTRELSGHDQIYQLLPSPDGRYLASTDYYNKLIIWSTKVNRFLIDTSLIAKNPSLLRN